jgi:hypothetical protein
MPEGRHSTKGMGKSCPADGEMLGDVYVPNGVLIDSGISNVIC